MDIVNFHLTRKMQEDIRLEKSCAEAIFQRFLARRDGYIDMSTSDQPIMISKKGLNRREKARKREVFWDAKFERLLDERRSNAELPDGSVTVEIRTRRWNLDGADVANGQDVDPFCGCGNFVSDEECIDMLSRCTLC